MTDEPRSRFAEPIGWVTPEFHYRHVSDLWDEAKDDRERRLLASAITRAYFSDCTPAEQECIRTIDARVGGPRVQP